MARSRCTRSAEGGARGKTIVGRLSSGSASGDARRSTAMIGREAEVAATESGMMMRLRWCWSLTTSSMVPSSTTESAKGGARGKLAEAKAVNGSATEGVRRSIRGRVGEWEVRGGVICNRIRVLM